MPRILIPYSVALERHPEEVASNVASVRRGKSKDKNTDPSTWAWSYWWGTRVQGYSFDQILSGKASADAAMHRNMTLKERVCDEIRRSMPMTLRCGLPRTRADFTFPATYVPPEMAAELTARHAEDMVREEAMALFTDEERAGDFSQLLESLKNPGFIGSSR